MAQLAKGAPQAKKLAMLRAAEDQRRAKLAAEVEGWMEKFDVNDDSQLDRDELRQLLIFLSPEGRDPPSEAALGRGLPPNPIPHPSRRAFFMLSWPVLCSQTF